MRRSDDRILTTHVGSLPRPPALRDLLVRQERGEPVDEAALSARGGGGRARAVRGQLEAGIDVGNDGEQPRVGLLDLRRAADARLRRGGRAAAALDLMDFPDYGGDAGEPARAAARILRTRRRRSARSSTRTSVRPTRECDLFLAVERRRAARLRRARS